jgi:RNA polymerase sigma factor for flagellar operon FliA
MTAQSMMIQEATSPFASETASDTTQLWNCYATAGYGSPLESQLVERHLPLVKTVVGRIAISLPPHVDVEDLHSAGLVGLLNAIRRFNPRSGASFETYARVRIRGAVLDELRRLDWVPRSIHEKARRVQEVMMRLEQEKGALPTDHEMAGAMDMPISEYRELVAEIRPATFVCLDSVRGSDGEDGQRHGDSLADEQLISPREEAARRELAQIITERIDTLPDVQRKVLALYYFEDLRLREIAEVFGVTESRICQIHAQAILALKSFLRRQDPELALCH